MQVYICNIINWAVAIVRDQKLSVNKMLLCSLNL